MRSISKCMIVNSFWPFSNALISIVISFLVNGFSPLGARGLGPASPGGPAHAQKCFDQLIKGRGKGQIHWISNQIINAIVGKGEDPLTIQSIKAFEKGQKAKGIDFHIFDYWSHMSICSFNLERCLCTSSIVSVVLRSPSGGKIWWKKRSLRIQGRMHIFRKMFQKSLNRVLPVPQHSTRRELSGATLKSF